MSSFLDLPDELILKVLSYAKITDLLSCGQVSKRIRSISNDNSLFQTLNLSGKCVKTDLLATATSKGCKSFNLTNSTIWGNLNLKRNSKLREDQSELEFIRDRACMFHVLTTKKLIGIYFLSSGQVINMIETISNEESLIKKVNLYGKFVKMFLEHLSLEGLKFTPKMVSSICQNTKTVQVLFLRRGFSTKG